jgi:hypothetical protein
MAFLSLLANHSERRGKTQGKQRDWGENVRGSVERDAGIAPDSKAHKQKASLKRLAFLTGAGEGIRTLDPNLGKVMLYP